MNIIADTNLLVRLFVPHDEEQTRIAAHAVKTAESVAVSVVALCELALVLQRLYKVARHDIAATIRGLINTRNVVLDRPVVEAGLAVLDAGGDFADGVIAFEGQWLGGETFVSFDKKAVQLLEAQRVAGRLLA